LVIAEGSVDAKMMRRESQPKWVRFYEDEAKGALGLGGFSAVGDALAYGRRNFRWPDTWCRAAMAIAKRRLDPGH
jgi:hypothetical protein